MVSNNLRANVSILDYLAASQAQENNEEGFFVPLTGVEVARKEGRWLPWEVNELAQTAKEITVNMGALQFNEVRVIVCIAYCYPYPLCVC